MRIRYFSLTVLILAISGIFLLICDVPTPPPGAEQANIKLILKSSDGAEGTTSITDTAGNLFMVGVILNLTQHIDSTEILVFKDDSLEYRFFTDTKKNDIDTILFPAQFPTSGDRTVLATGYINENENIELSAIIHVIARPQVNHSPELTVEGWDLVMAGDTVVLSATATDPDAGQSVTITAIRLPDSATFENDTLIWATTLEDTGTDTAIFVVQDNGDPSLTDTQTIIITVSPDPVNRPPALVITGRRVITAGEEMVLAVTATDPDSGQTITIEATRLPDGTTFEDDTIRWTPGEDDVGSDTIVVTATDDGDPARSSEETVEITVTETPVNEAPQWNSDPLRLSGITGEALSRSLADLCSDPDGDAVTFTLLSGDPEGDTVDDTTWSFTPSEDDVGTFTLWIVAADPYDGADTLTVVLTVEAAEVDDTTSPVIMLKKPSADSATTSASSYEVTVSCTDESGIAEVLCSMGEDDFEVTNSADTLYSAMVIGLQASEWNTIRFIGIDNAPAANRCTLYVSIMSDPEAPDENPPSITLRSPSKDTTIAESSLEVSVRCTDPESGVAEVTIGGVVADREDNDVFSATVSDLVAGENTITIIATDSAATRNTDSTSVDVTYDDDATPPTITVSDPSEDSSSTSSSSYTVTVECDDVSGVQSVNAEMGGESFTGTHTSGNNWDIAISGLAEGEYNEIVVTATDSSLRANTASETVYIIYDATIPDDVPPEITLVSPSKDTVIGQDNCVVQVRCTDASGIAEVTIGGEAAQDDGDDVFSATVTGLTAGEYTTVRIIATDAAAASNTDSVSVRIYYDDDAAGPSIELVTPANDSVSTNSASYTVTLTCTDGSGVASVNGVMNGTTFTGTRGSGGNWDITIEGLAEGEYNEVVFTATDSSLRANTSNETIYIEYDPTMDDVDGPTIAQRSGPESGDVISDAVVTIIDTVYDPSGVESVTWTLDGGAAQDMEPVTGTPGRYSLSTTLLSAGDYTIVVTATDNSSRHNESTQTIELTYVVAPQISAQSSSNDYCPGEEVTVSVTATGTPPLQYQWYADDVRLNGETNAAYTISSASVTTTLTCEVSNGASESVTSDPIVVTVNPGVSITQQPAATTNSCPNNSADISVSATGGTGLQYQWYMGTPPNGSVVSGAGYSGMMTRTLTVPGTAAAEGSYYCVVTNSEGCSDTSAAGEYAMNNAVTVSLSSTATTVCSGTQVTFTATPTGGFSHQYQWYRNDSKIGSPTTEATYATASAGAYYCTATSSAGCQGTSNEITLVVNTPPTIATDPSDRVVCAGSNTTMSVVANGTSYQWYKGKPDGSHSELTNNSNYSNVTSSILSFNSTATSMEGDYYCEVTSNGCTSISGTAYLDVRTVSSWTSITPAHPSICQGNSTTLSVNGTLGEGASWHWYSGSCGQTNEGIGVSSITVSPQTTTTYYVRAEGGCSGNSCVSAEVEVNDPPDIPFHSDEDVYLCPVSGRQTFIFSPVYDNSYSYQWLKDGNNVVPDPSLISVSGDQLTFLASVTENEGSYSCRITNASGCSAETHTWNVSVGPVIIQQPQDVTAPNNSWATMSVSVTGGSGDISYSWWGNNPMEHGPNDEGYELTDDTNFSGTNTATLSIKVIYGATVSGTYWCVIRDEETGCELTSEEASAYCNPCY